MAVLQWTVGLVALLCIGAVALTHYGRRRWSAATDALCARLETTRTRPDIATYRATELIALPAPVQRYLRAVLREGQPALVSARIGHRGLFNLGTTSENWKAFTSTELVVTARPGFVWDGRIALLPGLPVHVHDAYVAGEGLLHAAVSGLFTLADTRDRRELAEAELMRFLAESVWYPTALLPSAGVRWEPVAEHSARAILTDADLSVALTFHFDAQDLIAGVSARARGHTVGTRIEKQPWEGRFWNYAERGGIRVPLDGEVAWVTPHGRQPYWRGTLDTIRYELAR